MNFIRWGIIGPGNIANNFADGLKESNTGKLVAIASKNDERRDKFRKKSVVALACIKQISGLGKYSYLEAVKLFLNTNN